jgi:hypothetical protein
MAGILAYALSIKKTPPTSEQMAKRSKDNFAGLSDADKLRILQRNIKRT